MDLLIIIIIIMIFASQSGELGEKIKRTFDKKKSSTGRLRPDADYSNVRPEQGEEKAGDSFAEGVSDIDKKEKKESYEITFISDEISIGRYLYYLCCIYLL